MGEVLLKSNNGGAVSVWASTGLTTPDVQEVMATRFYTQMSAGNITRLGDLIKDAKSVINGGRDVRLSWALRKMKEIGYQWRARWALIRCLK
jgi:hypothetical protein